MKSKIMIFNCFIFIMTIIINYCTYLLNLITSLRFSYIYKIYSHINTFYYFKKYDCYKFISDILIIIVIDLYFFISHNITYNK